MNADASRAKNSNSELARRGRHCPAQHRQSSSAPTADVRRANVFPEKISFSVDNRLACIQGGITNYEYDRDSALSARSAQTLAFDAEMSSQAASAGAALAGVALAKAVRTGDGHNQRTR